jgi:hypothetical protein
VKPMVRGGIVARKAAATKTKTTTQTVTTRTG